MSSSVNECAENIIDDVGGLGRFQYLMIFLVLGSKVSVVWSALMMAFGGAVPNWHCKWKSENEMHELNEILPQQCDMKNNSANLVCTSKYFDTDMSSIVSEWDLVCDREWITATITTIQMGGILVGGFVSGHLADTYGRRLIFFLSLIILCIFNAVAAFSTTWQIFAVLRFFIGIGCGFYSTVHYTYLIEFVPPKYRSMVIALPSMPFWSTMFGLLTWWLHNWVYIQIAIAIATMPWLIGIKFAPESYRWLSAKGKLKQASAVVDKIAKWNKRQNTNRVTFTSASNVTNHSTNKKRYTVIDIFRSKSSRKITFFLSFGWFACGYGFYAISFGVQQLSGNIYMNWMLLSCMDFASIVIWYFTNCIGRKWTTFMFFLIGGLAGVIVGVLQVVDKPDQENIVNGLAFTSKLCVTSGFGALMILTEESYPTVVRNIGFGLHNSINRIGAMIAPQLVFASLRIPGLSYLMFGGLMLLAAMLSLCTSETNNTTLKDSLDTDTEAPTTSQLNKHDYDSAIDRQTSTPSQINQQSNVKGHSDEYSGIDIQTSSESQLNKKESPIDCPNCDIVIDIKVPSESQLKRRKSVIHTNCESIVTHM